ncbi:morphogenic membrane protein MmpA [Streptomyces sp. NPDC002643]
MTTHHASEYAADSTYAGESAQSVEPAVTAGMLLAVIAGLAWTVGMIYTLTGWAQ